MQIICTYLLGHVNKKTKHVNISHMTMQIGANDLHIYKGTFTVFLWVCPSFSSTKWFESIPDWANSRLFCTYVNMWDKVELAYQLVLTHRCVWVLEVRLIIYLCVYWLLNGHHVMILPTLSPSYTVMVGGLPPNTPPQVDARPISDVCWQCFGCRRALVSTSAV